jgi:hypothetical protein
MEEAQEKMANAWILLDEDQPKDSDYGDENSTFRRLSHTEKNARLIP